MLISIRISSLICSSKTVYYYYFAFSFTLGVQPKEKGKVTPNSQPTFTGMCSDIYSSKSLNKQQARAQLRREGRAGKTTQKFANVSAFLTDFF